MKTNTYHLTSYLLISLLSMGGYSYAQETLPGSVGSSNSQQTNSNWALKKKPSIQVNESSQQVMVGKAGIAYPIRQITIKGAHAFSVATLLDEIKASKNGSLSQLTFNQMQEISDVITNYYRARGYMVAKAVIPEQDITDGSLTILVLEGRLDDIRVNSQSGEVKERVQEVLNAQLVNGQPVERATVYRAVNIASEVTGQTVKVNLEPSDKSGGTRIEALTEELPKYYGTLSADNFGIDSTGKINFLANLGANSFFALGDKLTLQLGSTNNPALSNRYDVNYLVPVGNYGWSIGARAWRSTYQIGADFSAAQPYGYSQAVGIHGSYALDREETSRIDWRFGYNHVNLSENYLDGAVTNPRQADVLWTDIGGSQLDTLLTTEASTNWLLNLTAGNLSVDSSSYNYGTQTISGGYSVLSYQYSREQAIESGFSLFGNIRGQFASKNLDPYHKFNLGGPVAVRAYPIGEITGDDAVIGTFEARYTQPFEYEGKNSYIRLAAFYDSGWAAINHAPLDTQTTANTAVLAGYGVELNVGIGRNFQGRAYIANTTSGSYGPSRIDNASSRIGLQLNVAF